MRGQSRGPEAGTAERRGTTRGTEGTYERRGTTRGTEGTYERRGAARGTEGTYERRGTTRGTEGTYERRGTTRGTEGTYERRGTTQGSSRGTYDRRDSSRSDRGRYDNRGSRGSYGNRQQFHHRGPVTRCQRYGSGYRVWVGGAPYPFFVPLSYWHPSRFRVGLVINLGGYYNPGGYYDYYDGYRGYDYRSTSRGLLRGTVESVDYGRDTFVVRNEATGSFVTVIARDRRGRDVRPGDFVEMSGNWDRSGLFQAYDVDLLDDGYRDYRY